MALDFTGSNSQGLGLDENPDHPGESQRTQKKLSRYVPRYGLFLVGFVFKEAF
jgi:hypothetical protein